MKKTLATIIVLSLIILLTGCRYNINTNNPKVVVAATLLDASNTTVLIEDGLTAANHVTEQLESIEPEYYAHVKPLIKRISAANVVAAKTVQNAKNGNTAADWRGALIAVGASVKPSDLTAFGFKNPTSKALVSGGFATLIAILDSIPQKFGGK